MDEDIFIPLIIFSFILILVKMILEHKRWRHSQGVEPKKKAIPDKAMSLSELEDSFQDTVDLSVAPLESRLSRIEKQLRRLSPPDSTRLVAELEQDDTSELDSKSER